MSFGKMNTFIELIAPSPMKDEAGFAVMEDRIVACVRAYREHRFGNQKWANRAAFSTATTLFRFRKIPDVVIDTTLLLLCEDGRYRVLSAEDVAGRGMYVELLCEKIEPSVRR